MIKNWRDVYVGTLEGNSNLEKRTFVLEQLSSIGVKFGTWIGVVNFSDMSCSRILKLV